MKDCALYQVDAFSSTPFHGNPAGVCILAEQPNPEWMQNIAAEMNLAETAFLWGIGEKLFIRYYTPTQEVPLCGHATLATAHILFESGRFAADSLLTFHALEETVRAASHDGKISLFFSPDQLTEVKEKNIHELTEEVLGKTPQFLSSSRHGWVLAELDSEEAVHNASPKINLLKESDLILLITSRARDTDIVSRLFAPSVGINEDPVTGLAHTTLHAYWKDKLDKTTFTAYQASRRGGHIQMSEEDGETVVSGEAVTVFQVSLSPKALL